MTIRPEVPHAEIVLLTLFQIRERPGQSSQRATTRVPTFFRVEREELPYKSARRLKKREEEEDGRTDERAGERTNERTKTAVEVAVVKKEKEEKKARDSRRRRRRRRSFVRFSARFVHFVVLPASSLFPSAIGRLPNGQIKEIELLPFSLLLEMVNSVAKKERRKREEETYKRHCANGDDGGA